MNNENFKGRIVIIGAVAAGTSAAAKARRNSEDAQIVIYEKDRDISYSGCGLPYYIGGRVEQLSNLTPRDPAFFKEKYNIDIKTRHEVLAIDPDKKTVEVRDLESGKSFVDAYDILVLATGARAVRLPINGADAKHVFVLRNPDDARRIRSTIETEKPRHAAVIGSGFIGLEMVENLQQAGMAVTLIEKLDQVCPAVDPDMAVYIDQYLQDQGVQVICSAQIEAIESDGLRLADGRWLPADLVIMAVGVRPNVDLAKSIGLKLGPTGAVHVSDKMETSRPGIFACGDCAESWSVIDGGPLYRPLGSTANKMGRIAGDAITGGSLRFRGIAGTGIFKVFEMTVASFGKHEAQARREGLDIEVSHNIKPDKPAYYGGQEMVIKTIAKRGDGAIVGAQIIGFTGVDKRIDILVTAVTAGLKASDLFHLDLAYAPPFSTTKDPVIYTGMILDNAISRNRRLILPDELAQSDPEQLQIVDTRVPGQYQAGHVDQAVNIPHATFREKLATLDPKRPVVTYCNKGTTGNATQNILLNKGFKDVYTLSGGNKQYQMNKKRKTDKPD